MLAYYQRGSGGLAGAFTPVVKRLMIANVAIHILSMIMGQDALGAFRYYFALVPTLVTQKFFIWQFFTHMYLHGGFTHLLFNMFALWMFGSVLESVWGSRKFFIYYTICGVGGGICTWLLSINSPGFTVGASGGIYGLLLAYGILFPNNYIFLWFLIPIRAKHFVIIFGVLELLAATSGASSGIAHWAHLGGMIFGYIYLKRGLPGLSSRFRIRMPKKPSIRVMRTPSGQAAGRKQRIDEILDKITQQGIDTLTPEEKRILEETDEEEDY